MLSELCLYLKNWFDRGQPKYHGTITISENSISCDVPENQYYRIIGSVFNDGIYKRGSEQLTDETFEGTIWLMAIPQDVLSLSAEIEAWQAKYGGIDSGNMSPFNSESFAGYSYSRGGNSSNSSGKSSVGTWQSVFADRLALYRKVRL